MPRVAALAECLGHLALRDQERGYQGTRSRVRVMPKPPTFRAPRSAVRGRHLSGRFSWFASKRK